MDVSNRKELHRGFIQRFRYANCLVSASERAHLVCTHFTSPKKAGFLRPIHQLGALIFISFLSHTPPTKRTTRRFCTRFRHGSIRPTRRSHRKHSGGSGVTRSGATRLVVQTLPVLLAGFAPATEEQREGDDGHAGEGHRGGCHPRRQLEANKRHCACITIFKARPTMNTENSLYSYELLY